MKKIVAVMMLFTVLSCSGYHAGTKTRSGIYYRVKAGDTLHKIAQVYNVPVQRLTKANNLSDKDIIEADRVLFIPDADVSVYPLSPSIGKQNREAPMSKIPKDDTNLTPRKEGLTGTPKSSEGQTMVPPILDDSLPEKAKTKKLSGRKVSKPSERDNDVVMPKIPSSKNQDNITVNSAPQEDSLSHSDKKRFVFPVEGKIISKFGPQANGLYFNGIRIAAPAGSAVCAAADGFVIFSELHPLKEYGEAIIIKHDDNYSTVYTNVDKRLVKRDDQVKKGSMIASVAKGEAKREAMMHFEVRLNNKAINPRIFFPEQ